MIITCPSCATRYDVDDDRFSPDGRSVRCAECNESWFVPAPQPIENLMPLKAKGRKGDAGDD
ncbi:MAG: zinc-ribbon domain-containing protein, partial [Parvularculaceae bacterium]|nr:zinc-ribbon domain-containing protein [Parvularculaceae bacterium]